MNRREFVAKSGAFFLSPAFARMCGHAKVAAPPETGRSYREEMPDMLVSYLTGKLNELSSAWDRKRSQITTTADVETRNSFVREKLLLMLGDMPQRSPLRAITVKVVEKEDYRVENIMFCSRPNFWVTGNLYVPTSGKEPFPGIISPCGHYPLARMLPQYQSAYLSLVKNGFVVLAYDPIGQGERRQYWNPATDVTEVGGPIFEHSMVGQQLLLLGETLTGYFVWDGMRAIDYLLTRPEVDSERIGCAGHSGGGTMTKFITVADERVRCSAILEGGTANWWPTDSIGLADAEQNLFPAALYGIDNVDMEAAIAPRPLLVGIEHYGKEFNEAAHKIQACYRKLGAEEKFATVAADDPHSWTPELRHATTDWFCRWFYRCKDRLDETAYELSLPEDLRCTPDGSLRYSEKGATIFSLIEEKLQELPPQQAPPKIEVEFAAQQEKIRGKVRDLLRYERQEQPLGVRHIVTTPREGYHVEKIEFLSEPGIYIPAWVFLPKTRTDVSSTIVYVTDEGKQNEGMEFEGPESSALTYGILDQLARKGHLVVAVDVRGIGETRPSQAPSSASSGPFGQLFDLETSMAYAAWSTGRSLLGMRVQDVIRSVDYVMKRETSDSQRLHLIGKGTAGLWCLFAAALDSRIASLICVQSLLSYRSLAQVDQYLYSANVFIPDVLLHLDLSQIAAAVAPRPLALVEPKDAMKKTVEFAQAEETYRWTRDAYAVTGAEKNFRIECNNDALKAAEHYLDLMHAADGH